jgi:hypothetical protein
MKEKGIPLVGLECTCQVTGSWRKTKNNHEFECALKLTKQHVKLASNGQGKFAPCS